MTEHGRAQHQFLRNIIQGWVDYLVADMNEEEVQTLFKGFGELVSRACDVDLVKLARELPAGSGHMKNFKLGAITCLFAAVMMMAVGCGSTKQAADKAPLVKTAQAGTGTVASDNTYSGTVRGRYETNMSFQVGEQIIARNVRSARRYAPAMC